MSGRCDKLSRQVRHRRSAYLPRLSKNHTAGGSLSSGPWNKCLTNKNKLFNSSVQFLLASAQELDKKIPGIEVVFSPFYNVDSNMWNWSTLIFTETGAKQIIFGIERATDTIERSAISYSKLIEVAAIDCNWMEAKEQ